MNSDIEGILNDELGYIFPVIYRIQKNKMGFHGREVPPELKEEFIEGMIKLCRSEFEMNLDKSTYQRELLDFFETDTENLHYSQ